MSGGCVPRPAPWPSSAAGTAFRHPPLGLFHQGSAAGLLPERLDPILRAAYAKFNVPASFIDHVLHTPPESLWIPSEAEMRDAGFVTGPPPGAVAVTDDPVSPDWVETMKLTAGHQTRPCSSSPASCP
jgi:hypothetical protein